MHSLIACANIRYLFSNKQVFLQKKLSLFSDFMKEKIKLLILNKYLLFFLVIIIIGYSIWYTNQLASVIKKQEIKQANELANAYHILIGGDGDDLDDALEIIKNNDNIPIIWSDSQNNILAYKNFDSTKVNADSSYLKQQIYRLKEKKIAIHIDENETHFLYYKDSILLQKIKKYPYYQLFLVVLFFTISFIAFASIRKAEQNQVWVGLAKETAHQLGTPLTSISAWVEILKDRLNNDVESMVMLDEMDKDLDRLDLVAKRFSKIGSPPELKVELLLPIVENVVEYMKKRAAYSIVFQIKDTTNRECKVLINQQLFEWVLENLIKNALDAMERKGKIELIIFEDKNLVYIDVKDSGKGIPSGNFETVFNTGYSTKKRGWGLGLALSRRIIQAYHKGKLFVKDSVIDKGTTFRIILKQG